MRFPSFEEAMVTSSDFEAGASGQQRPSYAPPSMLTEGLQLCLAHYCDLHGPTPLMVTEGLPVPCSTCYEDAEVQERPPASPPRSAPNAASQATAAITDALRKVSVNGQQPQTAASPSGQEKQPPLNAQPRSSPSPSNGPTSRPPSANLETPPESPRSAPNHPPPPRRDSSFRRTYDDKVTKRAGPCENCAMTLPKRQDAREQKDPRADRDPTLRSRVPWAKVYTPSDQEISPPTSQASSASDTDGEAQAKRPGRRATGSTTTRSSMSSTRTLPSHTHYIHYTSTHEPVVPNSFSIVRASCLRALSFETLPRSPQSVANANAAAITPAQSSHISPSPTSHPFVTTHSAGAAASGGPIFFGDPMAGYTTAYIFRIPDVHARGHKRIYAFMALSTHCERLTMKTFGFIASVFRDLATWIQRLAEDEAEKAAAASPVAGSGAYYGNGGAGYPPAPSRGAQRDRDRGDGYGGWDRGSGSSFLTGGSGFTRRMAGGGSSVSLKSRGLAELVGLPDFFIQLHEKFVRLLLELGVKLSA